VKRNISNDLAHYKFIIEGYPRTIKKAEYFEKEVNIIYILF